MCLLCDVQISYVKIPQTPTRSRIYRFLKEGFTWRVNSASICNNLFLLTCYGLFTHTYVNKLGQQYRWMGHWEQTYVRFLLKSKRFDTSNHSKFRLQKSGNSFQVLICQWLSLHSQTPLGVSWTQDTILQFRGNLSTEIRVFTWQGIPNTKIGQTPEKSSRFPLDSLQCGLDSDIRAWICLENNSATNATNLAKPVPSFTEALSTCTVFKLKLLWHYTCGHLR